MRASHCENEIPHRRAMFPCWRKNAESGESKANHLKGVPAQSELPVIYTIPESDPRQQGVGFAASDKFY